MDIACHKSIGGELSIAIMEGITIGCCSIGMSMKVGTVDCTNSILKIWIKFGIRVDVIWNRIAFAWGIDVFGVKGW